MIDIEFSALTRLCLNQRITTREKLEAEIMAIIADSNRKRSKSIGSSPLAIAETS